MPSQCIKKKIARYLEDESSTYMYCILSYFNIMDNIVHSRSVLLNTDIYWYMMEIENKLDHLFESI